MIVIYVYETMKTLNQVIEHLGRRFKVSENEVFTFVENLNASDDFKADILGYYGLDLIMKTEDYENV